MRLWHKDLIPKLPRKQLLGQHRECCALRGKGWEKRHSVVDYVFKHPYNMLFNYHQKIMAEMASRGYKVTDIWYNSSYRGKQLGFDYTNFTHIDTHTPDYPEHNNDYMKECVNNLKNKGIFIIL